MTDTPPAFPALKRPGQAPEEPVQEAHGVRLRTQGITEAELDFLVGLLTASDKVLTINVIGTESGAVIDFQAHLEHDWSEWVFTYQSNEKRHCRFPGCGAEQYD